MNDLISRKALLEVMQARYERLEKMNQNTPDYADAFTIIDILANELPTIEAVPVVHGEWEEENMNYFCSQCKTAFCDDLAWITGELKLPNFCPNCGADMRKKVE